DGSAVVEGVLPLPRPVHELVADDELAELEVGAERTRCARAEDAPHAELSHRPHVRAVRDPVGRKLVARAVAGKEGDSRTADNAHDWLCRRLAVGRLDLDLLDVLEERVESRTPEDANLSPRHRASEASPSAQRNREPPRPAPPSRRPATPGQPRGIQARVP